MHDMRFDGGKLRALRTAKKWDQHRLAEAARQHQTGITQGAISKYENGMEPNGRNALALALALDVEVNELFVEDDDEEAAQMDVVSVLVAQARMHAEQARLMAELVARLAESAA